MYQIGKWQMKPVLSELIFETETYQDLQKEMINIVINTGIEEKEFLDYYTILELETGLRDEELLMDISKRKFRGDKL